ncbi:MAG TPA: zinc-dependent metalloprotease [Burkholderiaceae bacterium]|nr:zinc-dependent metalloprotease [Burkholderiaceae bacterium]
MTAVRAGLPSAVIVFALTGCANLGPVASTASAPAASGAATAAREARPAGAAASAPAAARPASAPSAAAPPAAGQPPAFATVIKDAKRTDGLLPVWRKDDKFWLEIPAASFDKPLYLGVGVSHSIGERGLVGGTMGPSWVVSFVRPIANQVQLVALNPGYVASGAARERGVSENFSRSLLASMPVASAPHPDSKAVLVDAAFLLSDLSSYGRALEGAFRMSYAPDRGNSQIRHAYADGNSTTVLTTMHFAVPRLPAPPSGPVPPGASLPTPPTALPDARSLFVGFVYSIARLPDPVMAPRVADGRLGHFTDTVVDHSTDRRLQQRLQYVQRWRMEKKDPQADLSEPVKPITFWLDRNIPPEFRQTVREGILAWNKAFEKIGLRNAVVVEQQPEDAEWDGLDAAHASVRWFFAADSSAVAVGPRRTDPRSGEILDADLRIGDGWTRALRREAVEGASLRAHAADPHSHPGGLHAHGGVEDACDYAESALSQMQFALDTLIAMGELPPDGPEVEAFVQGALKDVVMHEVGHALGLKHNFKASTVFTPEQLRDPDFTARHGIVSSVMDYNAFNLPLPGEPRGELYPRDIGPYDHWAIEYAYRPLDPAREAEELERIASRSTDPLLAYADDFDADGFGFEGVDPLVNRWDLGSDPLAYADRRLALTRALWQRAQGWTPRPGEGVLRQRSMFGTGFGQLRLAATMASKFIGGLHTVREVPGTPAAAGRKATFVPVDPALQRRALDLLARGIFSVDSFRFPPAFVANLAPDFVAGTDRTPVSIPAQVLRVQTAALDRLLSPGVASRLLELPLLQQTPPQAGRPAIGLDDLYSTLQSSIWSELRRGGEIDPLRRNLQREHLRRVQTTLVRSPTGLPPDALSLMRLQARRLQADLRVAAARPGLPVETLAHLEDSLAALTEALRASMLRSQ